MDVCFPHWAAFWPFAFLQIQLQLLEPPAFWWPPKGATALSSNHQATSIRPFRWVFSKRFIPFSDQFGVGGSQNGEAQTQFGVIWTRIAFKLWLFDFIFCQIQFYFCQIEFNLHHFDFCLHRIDHMLRKSVFEGREKCLWILQKK